ncbi:MAG: FADH(2)-oxidizing methylenetetrahydrofolate--tRNA-(uracil(54)-C(5))-methyltransferase TrmFO, partial [Bartonella sp.]|nr:FADH(2)-oxidizing methylenetetrahydrofolate--tRNA-(uracil(54)-C(5))-methyltransferase TrmFO [Bartonella sp.]
NHITGGHIATIEKGKRSFQPMNINFGLFPPIISTNYLEKRSHKEKKQAIIEQALNDCIQWLKNSF